MPPRKSLRNRVAAVTQPAEDTVVEEVNGAATKAKKPTKADPEAKAVIDQKPAKKTPAAASKKRKAAQPKVKAEEEEHECDSHGEEADEEEEKAKPTPKKRKTKKEKEDEAMPLAKRTVVSTLKRPMYIGAHVSGAGGKTHMHPPPTPKTK